MTQALMRTGVFPDGFFGGTVRVILDLQTADGAIPWHPGGIFDPWNHVESAMGLGIAGYHDAADRAFRHLAEAQERDGSWWGSYHGDGPAKKVRDSNFCAYVATGLWHAYRLTGNLRGLSEYWPVVEKAIGFVLSLQSPQGDIRWAAPDPQTPEDDALVAGCASIHKSLECAVRIGHALGHARPEWTHARARLGHALRDHPERFDRQWPAKSNFSMSWYYPVLGGVLRGNAARAHLESRWHEFVVKGRGCRCVAEQPWTTVAEAAELTLSLLATGQRARAWSLFTWQHQFRDGDGAYWMGHQFHEDIYWPAVKPAWTSAAMLLAADALTGATPAADLFCAPLGPDLAQ